ncbi:class I SAM-dependent methyltransferase [Streptomyces johnsoniae]|uniref:Class I SAM-dependent methyltransferase n=1 Tax=Streptomyces johnsoniae TaxID=3075532 RepID=A0ABU2SAB0_9ACTN|nr:class I SAM-dependent methyltransferase [Streptomyces sp. DSM 41886]MDT0445907.1 class I SAM-dependent methyltransferase [Streptomyces sp. DSM 41886]
MEVREFFNAAYGATERYWWRKQRRYSADPADHSASLITQVVLRHVRGLPPGRALDLGSGEGTDAIRMALLGWEVDAVEISDVGAKKIERFAYEAGARVTVHHTDALAFDSAGGYDLVVCNGLLHYVAAKEQLIARMQEMTAPGGCHAVSSWSTFTPVPPGHQVVPTFPDDEDGAITRAYRGWDKLLHYYERNRLEIAHEDMEPHAHSHIKMVALKPARPSRGARRPAA